MDENVNRVRGVSEETIAGVHRLCMMQETNSLFFAAINVTLMFQFWHIVWLLSLVAKWHITFNTRHDGL